MAFEGYVEEAGISDIFQLLALGKKTGCLSITDHCNFARVFFQSGRVVFASLVNRQVRLGERLLHRRSIREEDLAAAVAAQERHPERRLGELLVEGGALQSGDLENAVAAHLEETVYALFDWNRGAFHFEAGQQPAAGEVLISLDVPGLLLEGAQRADEWARIRRRIPHRRLVLRRVGEPPGEDARDAAAVWQAVDGARDLAAVVAAVRVEEFRALKALHDLLAAGQLAVVGESRPAGEPVTRGRQECRSLGLALCGACMYAEAAREFRQMLALDERDAEAHFFLGLVAFRTERLAEARDGFARVVELEPRRPAGYLNLALALEASGKLEEAERVVESLLLRSPDSGPGRLHQAILHYRRGAYPEALAILEELELELELEGPLQPVASFYRAMLHALSWDLATARELLASILRERLSARMLNNLGAVLERGGRLEEARAAYRSALEAGGADSMARKNLGDLFYREGKHDLARAEYVLALEDDPSNAEALNRLGAIAFHEGRGAEAVAYWERALESDPGHGPARRNLELAPSRGAS